MSKYTTIPFQLFKKSYMESGKGKPVNYRHIEPNYIRLDLLYLPEGDITETVVKFIEVEVDSTIQITDLLDYLGESNKKLYDNINIRLNKLDESVCTMLDNTHTA